jgi:hypothetical protein
MHQLSWRSTRARIQRLRACAGAVICVALCLATPVAWGTDSSAHQAQDQWQAQLEECEAYSQAQLRACLVTKAQSSEHALQQAEGLLAAAIERWDEIPQHLRTARAQLRSAGQEFLRYRHAQCALNTALGGGAIGNALEMRRLRCQVELNSLRAEQLRRMATATPLK